MEFYFFYIVLYFKEKIFFKQQIRKQKKNNNQSIKYINHTHTNMHTNNINRVENFIFIKISFLFNLYLLFIIQFTWTLE